MPAKVICPTCQQPVPPELFYRSLGRVKSKRKAKAAARNARKGGAPKGNTNWKGRLKD
jgi:hypothetical protein